MLRIDLNADVGEGVATDAQLLALVTSANVACGAHAGDLETMRRTVARALATGAGVGAHPGYADREGFGRREMGLGPLEIRRVVAAQIEVLDAVVQSQGGRLQHVKAHGALYNRAARDAPAARALADAVAAHDPALVFVGLPGSELEQAARAARLRFAAEVFADRTYQDDGSLTPRSRPDAFVHDAATAARRVLAILRSGRLPTASGGWIAVRADTVCVHGDNPEAVAFAQALREHLQRDGVELRPLGR